MRLRTQVVFTTLSKTTKHVAVFVLSIILARYFTKEDYGTYLQVQLIVSTVIYMSVFGIPHSIYYFIPKVQNKRRFAINTVFIMLSISIFMTLIVYLNLDGISRFTNNNELVTLSYIVAGFILLQIPIKLFEPLMIATKNVKQFVIINFIFNIGFFFSVLIPVLMHMELEKILISMMLLFGMQFLVIYIVTAHTIIYIKDDLSNNEQYTLSKQLRYSIPIGFSGVIGEISKQVDKIIVSGFFTPSVYAMYTRGAIEIPFLNVISHSMHNILMPSFIDAYSNNNTARLLEIWHSAVKMMALFVYPSFVFLLINAEPLIRLLFSEKYIDSVVIFQVYLLGMLSRVTTYDSIVRAVGKTNILLKITIFAVVANILITVLLIKNYGIIGAPIATVCVIYSVRLMYLKSISKLLELEIMRVFPWKVLGQILIISIFAILPLQIIRLIDLKEHYLLLAEALLYGPFYFFLIKKFSILTVLERNALQGILPPRMKWVI